MYLQQSQGLGLQVCFNQMQIAEGSYPPAPPGDPAAPQTPPPGTGLQPHGFGPLMEPGLVYDPYMSQHHFPQHLPPGPLLHPHLQQQCPPDASVSGLGYGFPPAEPALGPSDAFHPNQYDFPLDIGLLPPPAPGEGEHGGAAAEGGPAPGQMDPPAELQSEMMETVDSQHGFVLVN